MNKKATFLITLTIAMPSYASSFTYDTNQCSCSDNQSSYLSQIEFSDEIAEIFTQMEAEDDPNKGAFVKMMNSFSGQQNSTAQYSFNQSYLPYGQNRVMSSPTLYSMPSSGYNFYNQGSLYSAQYYPQQMMGQMSSLNSMTGSVTGGASLGLNFGLNAGVSGGFSNGNTNTLSYGW